MLAHVPSFGRNPRGSPDFLAYPVPKACMHALGTRVPRRLGVARSASSPKAAQALGCSLTPGLRISFGRVTCMARAASVPGLWALGFLLLACVCGWVRVAFGGGFCLPLPVVAGVLSGCVWARFVVLSLFCRLFVVFVVGLWCRPAFGTCVVSCAFPLPPCRFRFRCAVWACVLGPGLGCAPPFLAGLSGCVFCGFFFFSGCWVSLSWALWSLPPSPFFRAGLLAFVFFFFCLCSVLLFPLGRCSWLGVAGFGWVVPLYLFGGPVFGALWVGGLAPFCVVGGGLVAVGCFRAPTPPLFLGGGGGAPGCSSLCLSSAGACSVAGVWCGWSLATPGGGSCVLLPATPGSVSLPVVVGGPRHSWLGSAGGGGVWRWCVGGVVAGVWCGWSLATPGGGSCVLLPATPGWVSLPLVVGGPRHSWLGSACGGGVWCVVCWWGCGWCVVWLVPRHSWRRFLCATPRHSWLGFAAGGGGRSPPLLAGVRWRRWCVVCGVWCVVCGVWRWCVGGVVLVCGVVGPSPLLAEVPVCYSPPLLAGFRCRWWWAVPATPGWGPLAAVVCGVWCVAVVCWWGCGWCVLWLVPRHSWRRFLCATPRHSWLGFAAAGGGRSPPLLAGVRWRRRCVVCGGGVLLGLWLVCGVVGPSPLLAEVPVCYSPPLLAGFRCRWWWAVPATPGWGPLAAVVCGVVCGVSPVASDYAIGAVFEQVLDDGRHVPVAFWSRVLAEGQRRTWTPREKEAYAIVMALRKWAGYIALHRVTVCTDDQSLQSWHKEHVDTPSGPASRRARWHETLAKFDLTVVYVPGKDNTVGDCLSRWAYPASKGMMDVSAHGDEAETAEAKRIIEMERLMEEEGVKCFVVMAADAPL